MMRSGINLSHNCGMKNTSYSQEDFIEVLLQKRACQKPNLVIGIAGAGCIGKTTFARKFVQAIGLERCSVISLDGYMLERRIRQPLGLTGYNPQGFELLKARSNNPAALQPRRKINRRFCAQNL